LQHGREALRRGAELEEPRLTELTRFVADWIPFDGHPLLQAVYEVKLAVEALAGDSSR